MLNEDLDVGQDVLMYNRCTVKEKKTSWYSK